jgi:hypothetical protein
MTIGTARRGKSLRKLIIVFVTVLQTRLASTCQCVNLCPINLKNLYYNNCTLPSLET